MKKEEYCDVREEGRSDARKSKHITRDSKKANRTSKINEKEKGAR